MTGTPFEFVAVFVFTFALLAVVIQVDNWWLRRHDPPGRPPADLPPVGGSAGRPGADVDPWLP
jgi:hypothetical protein